MSGWENVPEEAPSPRKPQTTVSSPAEPGAAATDASTVEDGELARLVNLYWPQAWLIMLTIVSLIGVWAAIGKLPNAPSWWP